MTKHFPFLDHVVFDNYNLNDHFIDIIGKHNRVQLDNEFEQFQVLLLAKSGQVYALTWGRQPLNHGKSVQRGTDGFKIFAQLIHELSEYVDVSATKFSFRNDNFLYWQIEAANQYDEQQLDAMDLVGKTSLIRDVRIPGSVIKNYQLLYDQQVLMIEYKGFEDYPDLIEDDFIQVEYYVNRISNYLTDADRDIVLAGFISAWNEVVDPIQVLKSGYLSVETEAEYRARLVEFDTNALANKRQASYDAHAKLEKVINESDSEMQFWNDKWYVVSGISRFPLLHEIWLQDKNIN
ncbi:hypothetical protein [Nicoliella lavandulae]|uniref:Uncharacterized protein n=1 Tax=Nicoliella lavandulae TaxID=3082954 RepID=A0ABU8SK92_9LACO